MFQKVVCQNSVESKPNRNHIPKPKLFLIFQVYASFHFHSPGFIQYAAVSILVLYLYLFLAFFFFLLLWLKVLTFRLVPKKTEDFKKLGILPYLLLYGSQWVRINLTGYSCFLNDQQLISHLHLLPIKDFLFRKLTPSLVCC